MKRLLDWILPHGWWRAWNYVAPTPTVEEINAGVDLSGFIEPLFVNFRTVRPVPHKDGIRIMWIPDR